MFFQVYRPWCVSAVLAAVFLMLSVPIFSLADETEATNQKLEAIFPKAKKFVQRTPVLTPDQIVAIEKELGAKLQPEDLKPVFYIPISEKKKPMGLVLFADAKGPHGVIEGAVGLNMRGKVVKVEVYGHKESDVIVGETLLKQFVGMGIDDAFKIGVDIEVAEGHEDAASAVSLIPKKTLVMSYALFHKSKTGVEKAPESDVPKPDLPEEEMPEVEDLKELMMLMIDDYFIVIDYFDDKESKTNAVAAAKRLARYGKGISGFEPPKNADQTEEYVYLQDKFSDTLLKFAAALEKEGISDETRKQWDSIVTLINQAHLRFSEEEIDLDTY